MIYFHLISFFRPFNEKKYLKSRLVVMLSMNQIFYIFSKQMNSMQSIDKLLTNTTNKLALQPLQELSQESSTHQHNSHHQQPIIMPTPIHPQRELAFLVNHEQFLQQQITQAKEQQRKMLQLFQQIGKLERGQAKIAKKLQRRRKADIINEHKCPHQDCERFYSTQATLQRHIKLKHKIVKNEPPQPFRDLPPWPNLNSCTDNSAELSCSDFHHQLLSQSNHQ